MILAASVLATGTSSCRKRLAPGTCAEDIDCPPGHDCRGGACVKRPPEPGTTPAPPDKTTAPDSPTPSEPSAAPAAEIQPTPDAGVPHAPPKRKAAPPAPVAPPVQTPAAPPGPLPMWKQRLKNT